MNNSSTEFFGVYDDVEPNAIQRAQNAFMQDKRSASADVAPEERKHSAAQGFLLNDEARETQDLDGSPINDKPGVIFEMKAIREALKRFTADLLADPDKRRYLGPGDAQLKAVEAATKEIVFGENDPRIVTVPVPGMAVGFKEVAELIQREHPHIDTVIKGTNGYGGYNGILSKHFKSMLTYRHATDDNKFDLESFEAALRGLDNPSKVMLLMQSDAYNYIGVNSTPEQKKRIVELLQELGIFTLVDSAYQGLVNGLDEDVELIRLLAETELPFVVYDSYSKKAQLYGERVGFLHFATGNEEQAAILRKNLFAQLRNNMLTGSINFRIIYQLLNDPELKRTWTEEDIPGARAILAETKTQMAELLGPEFGFVDPKVTQGMFNGVKIKHEGAKWMQEKGLYVVDAKNEDTGKEALRVNMGSLAKDARPHIAGIIKEAHEKFAT
ncbi:aminotransferase class I/II-fold pyridoxal phosphate-dependent enzyme [Patescibacteria group bacterium]